VSVIGFKKVILKLKASINKSDRLLGAFMVGEKVSNRKALKAL
jgi:hypothetical protein